jgi:hypothetical protein
MRSWLLFGDPLLLNVMFAVLPGRAQPAGLAQLLSLAPGVWRSFWAVFGWFNVVVDEWVYWLFSALTVAGVAGWCVGWLRSRRTPRAADAGAPLPRVDWATILLLAGWTLLVAVSLGRWAQISYPQGRLLFPALSSFATLLAWGLLAWLPRRFQGWGAGLLALGLALLAAVAPFRWIQPVYAAPALLPAGTPVPNPVDVRFGAAIRLVGYDFAPAELQPGAAIDVTLYWQTDVPLPDDLSVFLHGTDELEVLAAQRDSYPGGGLLPTSQWPVGAIVTDRHRLLVPETAMAPSALRLDVGLYDHRTGERLPVAGTDAYTLGTVTLAPRPTASGLPHEADIDFGDQMRLVGYDFDRRVLAPGETLTVTLWWEGLRPMTQDYVVFAHLLEPPDRVWAQDDQMPQEGAARTSTWEPGVRVEDRYELRLPAEAPPGVYRVEIGVYDKDSFDRLPVDFSDQGVVLGQVRVR